MIVPWQIRRSALISDCGQYRYWLHRDFGDAMFPPHNKGPLVWCMLNPSTADADIDDATIRKCLGFTDRFGYASMMVVNLYAFRATDPGQLANAMGANGPDNDFWLQTAAKDRPVICAWGSHRMANVGRTAEVRRWFEAANGGQVYSIGKTKGGCPRHPLYVPYTAKMEKFLL